MVGIKTVKEITCDNCRLWAHEALARKQHLLDLTLENIKLREENKYLRQQLEAYINGEDTEDDLSGHWLFDKERDEKKEE